MLSLKWINESLAIGPAFTCEDIAVLKAQKLGAVIDLRLEASDDKAALKKAGVEFLHVDIADTRTPTKEQLERIFDFALPKLEKNVKILIHCQNGYGRSALVAVAVLVKQGLILAAALKFLYRAHPEASLTKSQEYFVDNIKAFIERNNL